jgi:adenylate cyclase
MVEVIMQNGGTVDKFMGDAILAVFGVPKPLPESEKAAVQCALEMHACLKKLNRKRNSDGLFTLEMGIGIAAGDVVAGNIGSDKRMEYTVIGDAVNTASRLQSIATSGKILVTNRILDKVMDVVQYRKLPPVPIKGKRQPMEVIEILSLKKTAQPSAPSDPSIIEFPILKKKAEQ